MFGNLKEKLLNVSKNVKLFSDQKPTEIPICPYNRVNLNAGASILNHYQQHWKQIHEQNEVNAQKAVYLSELIVNMYEKIDKDHHHITDMIHLLNGGNQSVSRTIQQCVNQIEQLTENFEQVEHDLLQLENLIENLELQEKQLEHRFQLALYKERKLANLETLRTDLAEKHAQSMIEHELRQKHVSQERQQAFQDAFQTDLQMYKEAGVIPKIDKQIKSDGTRNLGLEEIQLDCDTKDLEQFLDQ